jgi:hypothetical protein
MAGLVALSVASVATAKPLRPVIAVQVPASVTQRSMDGVNSETVLTRTKLQRDQSKPRPRPAGAG